MLHNHVSEETTSAQQPYTTSLPPIEEQAALTETEQARLEDFLDAVCAPLIGKIPYAARLERRAEVRQHLDALVQAYLELGDTPEKAVAQALAKFGAPERLAWQWRHAQAAGSRRMRIIEQPRSVLITCGLCVLMGFLGFELHGLLLSKTSFTRTARNSPVQIVQPTPAPVQEGVGSIDDFVLRRLEAQGLKSAETDSRRQQIRRLSYDLVGLPPTEAAVEAFESDRTPDAYERLVRQLRRSAPQRNW